MRSHNRENADPVSHEERRVARKDTLPSLPPNRVLERVPSKTKMRTS